MTVSVSSAAVLMELVAASMSASTLQAAVGDGVTRAAAGALLAERVSQGRLGKDKGACGNEGRTSP